MDFVKWLWPIAEKSFSLLVAVAAILIAGKWAWVRLDALRNSINLYPSPETLRRHRFFAVMRNAVATQIPNLPIQEEMRRLVFRDFLAIKFRVFKIRLGKWLDENVRSLDSMTPVELESSLMDVVTTAIKEYEEAALKEGIPEVVVAKFRDWHACCVASVVELIASTCHSDWHKNNTAKVAVVFDTLLVAFHRTLADARRTLYTLNGELDGVVYKGVVSQRRQLAGSVKRRCPYE